MEENFHALPWDHSLISGFYVDPGSAQASANPNRGQIPEDLSVHSPVAKAPPPAVMLRNPPVRGGAHDEGERPGH